MLSKTFSVKTDARWSSSGRFQAPTGIDGSNEVRERITISGKHTSGAVISWKSDSQSLPLLNGGMLNWSANDGSNGQGARQRRLRQYVGDRLRILDLFLDRLNQIVLDVLAS